MNAIEVKGLKKSFKRGFLMRRVFAVRDLSFLIEKGEVYGLLGPNGAGKTTTIKIISGLLYPDSGEVIIMGNLLGTPHLRKKIGFLPENPQFHEFLTGFEFLKFHGDLLGLSRSEIKEKCPDLIKTVGLSGAGEMSLRSYSKGMIQRIGLAQALLGDPEILILDEPMSGLDPIGRKELRDLIISLKEKGKTIFFSTHILPDVETICDRIGVILNGALKGEGKLGDIMGSKIKSYEISFKGGTESLLESLKKLSSRIIRRGDEVFIHLEREENLDNAIKHITDEGGKLLSLIPHRETLEEYFVREFRGEWAEK